MESCSLMFYNQDMTDAAGVKPPQAVAGWTMAEAKAAWQKRSKKTRAAMSASGACAGVKAPTGVIMSTA